MTAFDLIESIFSRPAWRGQPGEMRRVTREQFVYLRGLIERDPERGALRKGAPGSMVWTPAGLYEYVLTEDLAGDRHTLTRMSAVDLSGAGMLF